MKLSLEQIAEKARAHVVTPSERREQRVSLIMGLQSKGSCRSREDVETLLDSTEGHEAHPPVKEPER